VKVTEEPNVTVVGLTAKEAMVGTPPAAETTRVVVFVAVWLAWSDTVTVTVEVPAAEGRHGSVAVLEEVHPAGRPE
jgi:hypothetical protein